MFSEFSWISWLQGSTSRFSTETAGFVSTSRGKFRQPGTKSTAEAAMAAGKTFMLFSYASVSGLLDRDAVDVDELASEPARDHQQQDRDKGQQHAQRRRRVV